MSGVSLWTGVQCGRRIAPHAWTGKRSAGRKYVRSISVFERTDKWAGRSGSVRGNAMGAPGGPGYARGIVVNACLRTGAAFEDDRGVRGDVGGNRSDLGGRSGGSRRIDRRAA